MLRFSALLAASLLFHASSKAQELRYGDSYKKVFTAARNVSSLGFSYPESHQMGDGLTAVSVYSLRKPCGEVVTKTTIAFWVKDDSYILYSSSSHMPMRFNTYCMASLDEKQLSSDIRAFVGNAKYVKTKAVNGNEVVIHKSDGDYLAYCANYRANTLTKYVYKDANAIDIILR